MKTSVLQQLVQAQQQLQAIALVTCLDDETQSTFIPSALRGDSPLESSIAEAFRRDKSQVVEIEGARQFIQIFNSPLRLMIVGAVHIAKPLISMGQSCGYEVTLIDPRRAFASAERFPDVTIVNGWPDKVLTEVGLDARTAVVTLTHDPKVDEPALIAALQSEVFYIGALGSRRTHRERCTRLEEAGMSAQQLQRIRAPIGLDISAQSPAEIAVSIMAEMTECLRKGNER